MSDMIDGNMIALRRYEREIEQAEQAEEQWSSFISWASGLVDEIKDGLDNYDANSLNDMSGRIDKAIEQLEEFIGKLEGER